MKKDGKINSIKTILFVGAVMVGCGFFPIIPWWGFVIPVAGIGVLISFKKWEVPCFATGFLAGFGVWLGATLFFNRKNDGQMLDRLAHSIGLSGLALLLVAGLTGGLLTGLALYTGGSVFRGKEPSLQE